MCVCVCVTVFVSVTVIVQLYFLRSDVEQHRFFLYMTEIFRSSTKSKKSLFEEILSPQPFNFKAEFQLQFRFAKKNLAKFASTASVPQSA